MKSILRNPLLFLGLGAAALVAGPGCDAEVPVDPFRSVEVLEVVPTADGEIVSLSVEGQAFSIESLPAVSGERVVLDGGDEVVAAVYEIDGEQVVLDGPVGDVGAAARELDPAELDTAEEIAVLFAEAREWEPAISMRRSISPGSGFDEIDCILGCGDKKRACEARNAQALAQDPNNLMEPCDAEYAECLSLCEVIGGTWGVIQ